MDDLYQIGNPIDEIIVTLEILWHGFLVPVTEEMTQILRQYDVCPLQLPPMAEFVFERAIFFAKIFFLNFGYQKIMALIEFIEDPCQLFPIIETFDHEEFNLSFIKGNKSHKSFRIRNSYHNKSCIVALYLISYLTF